MVLVRGIEEGGEARGDESRPLPVWHPGRKVGKVTSRARAAQAVEGAVRDAQAAQGTGGKERVQGVGMAVDEEATLVLRKGRGRPKRSAKVSWRSGRLCSGGAWRRQGRVRWHGMARFDFRKEGEAWGAGMVGRRVCGQ